jgi:hypothetical protein
MRLPLLLPALVVVQLAASPQAAAADELGAGADAPLPCRPTIACTAEFMAPGKFEVELGYAGRNLSGGFQHTTPVLAKVTVSEALQLQVGTNGFVAERPQSGYVDGILLVGKMRLLRQTEALPAVAILRGRRVAAVDAPARPGSRRAGHPLRDE